MNTITTQRDLRRQFWLAHPDARRPKVVVFGNDEPPTYCTDTRVAFCEWVDKLARGGVISKALADRATL